MSHNSGLKDFKFQTGNWSIKLHNDHQKVLDKIHFLATLNILEAIHILRKHFFYQPQHFHKFFEHFSLSTKKIQTTNLFLTSKIEFSNPPILQFSNLKCCLKAKEP